MGVIEKLQEQIEDLNKGMAILLERTGMTAKASEKAADKPASEKALEAAATGRRGRGAATEEAHADEKPAGRGRGRAAAADKPKAMTAGEFEEAITKAFNVEDLPELQAVKPPLTEKDFDNIYEDFGVAVKPILEHVGVDDIKKVKKEEDRQFVLHFFKLATTAAAKDEEMPTVQDVEDSFHNTGDASGETEEKPARRSRR